MVAQVVIPRRRVTTLAQFDGRALRVALRDLCSRARCVGHGVVPDSSLLVEGAVAHLRVPSASRAPVEAALVDAQVGAAVCFFSYHLSFQSERDITHPTHVARAAAGSNARSIDARAIAVRNCLQLRTPSSQLKRCRNLVESDRRRQATQNAGHPSLLGGLVSYRTLAYSGQPPCRARRALGLDASLLSQD